MHYFNFDLLSFILENIVKTKDWVSFLNQNMNYFSFTDNI